MYIGRFLHRGWIVIFAIVMSFSAITGILSICAITGNNISLLYNNMYNVLSSFAIIGILMVFSTSVLSSESVKSLACVVLVSVNNLYENMLLLHETLITLGKFAVESKSSFETK